MSYQFEIKKLVLVDSAGFCYVELPVDHHGILLGEGNLGKSSLLNSLRLFLLPENNFKHSKKKFAFATPKRDGFYDNEESYYHYFPSKFSFLILEVESQVAGQRQTHCQILHRSSGHLAYERIFTTLDYQQFRHLFWDGSDDADGIGYRVDNLTPALVFNSLKKIDKYVLSVKEPNKLKTLMYQGELVNSETLRYNIFPMNEIDEGRVESLRTLIFLLFDMNASSEPVAQAVANIIEADKKFVDDMLDFNIEQFLQVHNQLKARDTELNILGNLTDKFQKLQVYCDQYYQLDDCEIVFASFIQQLDAALDQNKQLLAQQAIDYGEAKKTEKHQSAALKQLTNDYRALQSELATYQKQLTQADGQIVLAENLLLSYPNIPIAEVIELITEDIHDNQKRLAALENASQKALRVEELTGRIAANRQLRDKHQENLNNQDYALEQQLSMGQWQVLTAVNKKLALANPKRSLTDHERQTIGDFTDLFRVDNDYAEVFDERFLLQTSSMLRDDQTMVQNLTAEIKNDSRELEQLTKTEYNVLHKADQISRLKREVQQADNELRAIEDLNFHRKTTKNLTEPMAQCQQKLEALQVEINASEQALQQALTKSSEKSALREQSQQLVDEQVQLHGRCEHYLSIYPRIVTAMQQSLNTKEKDKNGPLTAIKLNELVQNLHRVNELGDKLLLGLREFVMDDIIKDEYGILTESPSRQSIMQSFNQLQGVFRDLPSNRKVLDQQVRTHNESVQGYTHILQKNYQHIKRFERQLNDDFSKIEINDLTGVEVNIHIAQRFENLVNDTSKIDLFSTEQLPEHFYQRLEAFAGEFFKTGETARLTMDKIIRNLSYRTRKKQQQQWQTKQQSNSTTALINLKLVQILLGRLRRNDCRLIFPLILDEVATVDINQFDWLLDDIKASGFNLFAASTHSASAELIFKIGRHFQLGDMRSAKPYSAERSMVYWGGAEYFTDQDGLQMALEDSQRDLFEAIDE